MSFLKKLALTLSLAIIAGGCHLKEVDESTKTVYVNVSHSFGIFTFGDEVEDEHYHSSSCKYLTDDYETYTVTEAKAKGYIACEECRP